MKRAETVMRELPSHDWSDWFVCVYDDLRQIVEAFDFPAMRALVPLGLCTVRRGVLSTSARLKPHH